MTNFKPMDEKAQHEVRASLRLVFLEEVLIAALRKAAGPGPDGAQALERLAADHLARAEAVRFPGADPAHAQLLADEYVEVVREFSRRLLDRP